EVLDNPAADVVEGQRLREVGALIAHSPNQTYLALAGEREDREEVGLLDVGVELAIDCETGSLHVGNIEEMAIGAARKGGAHRLADDGPHAVAAGDVGGLAALLPAVRTAKTCGHSVALITVSKELRPSLDDRAQLLEPRDQQPLMLVLRKDVQEGIGRESRADLLKRDARSRLALDPQPDGRDLVAARDHVTGEIELAIELERSRMDRQCAGGRAGL